MSTPYSNSPKFSIIAHNIRSLHNVGSIFRIADALGVGKVYLTGYTGSPPEPKLAKVALGAENFVPWEKHKSAVRLIKKLKSQEGQPGRVQIIGLENNLKPPRKSSDIKKFKPQFPLALLIGEETKGINKKLLDLCDYIVEIPMQGQKESLNVSVACGIAVHVLLNK